MQAFKICLRVMVVLFCVLSIEHGMAQDNWASLNHSVPVKAYEGKRFKLQAMMKADVADDSASARLWARVDKANGTGFFDNMWLKPVRSKDWKSYTIEGKIDTGAVNLVFGALTEMNGKFYYDNVKLQVETKKNKWETIYTEDFEKTLDGWKSGIAMEDSNGVNNLFRSLLQKNDAQKGQYLLIEGSDVPNYGFKKDVGKFAEVNGIKLYYEIYGEGAPLVVLHGNGGSISSAGTHYPDLIKQYKVIAIDSRSQGRSTDTDQPLNYDVMASDVNALLDQLNIDSVFIWGQSDGAILGLVLAMDYPKKVKRVVAYGANIQPDTSAIFPWAVNYMNKLIATSKDVHEVKLNVMMRDFPNIPYEKLHTIKAPVLIMGGDRDVIRPEHLVKMFQNIPNSQLCILPGATHGGSWEKKAEFLQIMNDFFNKPFTMPDTKDWFKE